MANGLANIPSALAMLDNASRAIAEAKSVGEVKDIRDKAESVRAYLKQRGASFEAQQAAAEVKIRAERKIGAILSENLQQGRPSKKHSTMECFYLSDIGLTGQQSHRYQLIASLSNDDFEQFISGMKEAQQELSSAMAYRLGKRANDTARASETIAAETEANGKQYGATDLQGFVDDGLKFATIYADPPWQYENQGTRAATSRHYSTMTVDQLCEMPIAELAAEQSHLYLWTTNGFLFDSKRVIEAWGFEFKSCFVWVKPQMGIGNYWRLSHEFLLLGTRGGLVVPPSCRVKSWMEIPRGKHSAKPDAFRHMIEKMSPGPRLEMFCRRAMKGWTVFGDQVGAQKELQLS